jgi:hypothetical protein
VLLAAWSVFCLGCGLLGVASATNISMPGRPHPVWRSLGNACILWAAGVFVFDLVLRWVS